MDKPPPIGMIGAMLIRVSHVTTYRYDTPATSVIQIAAADPAQPRRPVRHQLAHRRLGRLPPRPARGRVRQHHPRLHGRWPVRGAQGPGRGRGRDPRHPGRRARRGRAVSAEPLSARDPADEAGRRDRRLRGRRAREGGATTRCGVLHLLLERLHDEMRIRHRPDPCDDHRRGSLRAQARRLPGPHPYLHRGRAQPRRSRRAMSAAISAATTA